MYFYLGYAVLLYFAFTFFPWWFSHGLIRATGGWLLTPAYPPFVFVAEDMLISQLLSLLVLGRFFACIWGLKQKIIVKQQNIANVPMRPPLMPLIHLRGFKLRPSAFPWSVPVPGNSLSEACCMPMTFTCSLLISRVKLSAVWPCKCHLPFS